MFTAFFDSFRYVGHMLPLAVLRIFMGYQFLEMALLKTSGDFLIQPRLAAEISEWLPQSGAPVWYKSLVGDYVVEHWRVFAYTLTYCEFVIAISFLIGFFVRPVALLGFFITANHLVNSSPDLGLMYKTYLVLFVVMMWIGAGRCIGFDYFFFKRRRGLWW